MFNFSYAEKIGYPTRITEINAILFGIYFLFNFIILLLTIRTQKKENDLENQLQQQAKLQEYMSTLELLYKYMRTFRHDYVNVLSTMKGFMMENNMPALNQFFEERILPFEKNITPLTFEIGKLSNMHLIEIKGLLYTKVIYALSLGIHVNLDIPFSVTNISIDVMDFSRILGVFLDNSIEASIGTTTKQIDIFFLQEEYISMAIGNTCTAFSIPLSELPKLGISTKGTSRGLGLHTVAKILQRYPDTLQSTIHTDNYFEQRLEHL